MGAGSISIQETTNRKNLSLLLILRWLAVGGQVAAIAVAHLWLGIGLPLLQMACVVLFLVGLNVVSLYLYRSRAVVTDTELFIALLLDVAALTIQLYLSGGATNPFVSLFLLQVILGAVLLRPWATWTIVLVTSCSYVWLTAFYEDIGLSMHPRGPGRADHFGLHIQGMFICFVLAAVLLVLFITRIARNLRDRDARLADLARQSAEEEQIVRMGLLASGAAHELGTPLATLSVILNDWERMPALRGDQGLAEDFADMRTALGRCKEIISQILVSSGEARGEEAERTTLGAFLQHVVESWRGTRSPRRLDYVDGFAPDEAIVSDAILKQILFSVLDNALEASPDWVGIATSRQGDQLLVEIRDRGPGFTPEMLAGLGKPYQSTKNRPGSGLGLFLVVNVLRKLGGAVTATNDADGGAVVRLRLPIAALSIAEAHGS
ncbi:MAG: ATP-binding protein [Dongiaceae bacterium]